MPKYHNWTSAFDLTFWNHLKHVKLNETKLDDTPIPIHGTFTFPRHSSSKAFVNFSQSSFDLQDQEPPQHGNVAENSILGSLIILNTMEEFKSFDYKGQLKEQGASIWEFIQSGRALEDPSLLYRFCIISFGDLKSYSFYYWCMYPSLYNIPYTVQTTTTLYELILTCRDEEYVHTCADIFHHCFSKDPSLKRLFILVIPNNQSKDIQILPAKSIRNMEHSDNRYVVGYYDPSPSSYPSSVLCNILALISMNIGEMESIDVLSLKSPTDYSTSIIQNISFQTPIDDCFTPCFKGLETNKNGKLGPRSILLNNVMDPRQLASNSVDLNIRLMRWRAMPDLDLEVLSSTKCLLVGAGTLGCSVARILLGWGIKHIDFIDCGYVSYSNPVRQSLYLFDDCIEGKTFKATAASKMLSRIYPDVQSEGHVMSIPMPGHLITSLEDARSTVEHFDSLIQSHDVIFLLTDSRESRWLPTLMASAHDKLCINAAIGFDTYSLIRHGPKPGPDSQSSRLGCYFCGDITVPSDSLKDRTLDQQCTVSRPGLSSIVSALAVELMISIIHHPLKHHAPFTSSQSVHEHVQNVFGILPHRIVGYLAHYQNTIGSSQAFDKCSACSFAIINMYEREGVDFIIQCLQDVDYLSNVSGLSQLYKDQEDNPWELDIDWEISHSE